ncbi:NAD(P)H-dependent oxidoreductase [Thiosulfativibrio zosterae]|uniref:NAD(P)H-dependent oxidoreductase n=1 Tax=Thiosulfativibrio zosterae TaxID=2675053 RepID=A0A6F8PJN8_9GAMM|nr:NAD(P)H-dependent oxidoreductase [Thiosulfativibrio zosterae]BBP42288.1 NAD(P)H-dependent oxidoreductase [Thiosulfativibrio zosterae]
MNPSTLLEPFHFRHACKVMDANQKIPADQFATILEAARLSPSSFGYEPWRFLVVQNMALRDKLKPHTWGAQNTLPTASHFVIALARTAKGMRYDSAYIQHMMQDIHHLPAEMIAKRKGFYQAFQESDFDLLSSERALFDWSSKQTYIALANMMTVAAQMQIDSCPIEGFKTQEVMDLLASDFGVDTTEFQIAYMVAFGYRVNPQNPKTRQPIDDICEWFE